MSLRRRLVLGLLIALAIATGLQLYLTRATAEPVERAVAAPRPQKMAVNLGRGVPRGRPWLVYLCWGPEAESLPDRFVPVVEIRPGGAVNVLRAVPRPEGPEVDRQWLCAAVKLPRPELRLLTERERAQFLALLGAWEVRSTGQFGQIGTRFRPSELAGLMHWLR